LSTLENDNCHTFIIFLKKKKELVGYKLIWYLLSADFVCFMSVWKRVVKTDKLLKRANFFWDVIL